MTIRLGRSARLQLHRRTDLGYNALGFDRDTSMGIAASSIAVMLVLGGTSTAPAEQPAAPVKAVVQTPLEQEFTQLLHAMQDGKLRGDKAVAERTLADGFFATDEVGALGGEKAKVLQGRSHPEGFKRLRDALAETKFTTSIEDVRVAPHGDTVAVSYRLVQRLVINGEPVVKQVRSNEVFVRSGGRWQSILHTDTVIPGQPFAANIDTRVYDEYVGEYRLHATRSYTITRDGDGLFFQAPGASKTALVPENDTTFAQSGGTYYRIAFIRDDAHRVTHLRVKEFPGVEYNAIRVK